MKLSSLRVLDQLAGDEPCLAAVFCSYSFDPQFFEEHVIRTVLRLDADPAEDATRYHGQARRALQHTPVAVIVDASQRQAGRRLPYDLLEVSTLVFHPKSVLLLFREFARLMIGSGNLTKGGYGNNSELFLTLDLRYDEPADAGLLASFDAHLERVSTLVRQLGTQLGLVRDELRRRLGPLAANSEFALYDSLDRAIIEQIDASLPANARIEQIGFLAPFWERDDTHDRDGSSVLDVLLPRASSDVCIDVGVAWDNASVIADFAACELGDGLDQLWGWSQGEGDERSVEYLIPQRLGARTLAYLDDKGHSRRCPLPEALEALEERQLWRLPEPIIHAPRRTISAVQARVAQLRLWLHPATRASEGRALHRPLHAKLLTIAYRTGRREETLFIIGSPNMSRRALLLRAGVGAGNVELALGFKLAGLHQLPDIVPELVYAPDSALASLREREFPPLGRNWALAIERALYDPAARTLSVRFAEEEAVELPTWTISYRERELLRGLGRPRETLVVADFDLHEASAELILHVEGNEYSVPILVTDLATLPADPKGASLGLHELLWMLGRRIGAERAVEIAAARQRLGDENDNEELTALFAASFSPTDVFKAWWAVAEELADPELSVHGFRVVLEGPMSPGAVWRCMTQAQSTGTINPGAIWFYGAELLRTLHMIALPDDLSREAKQAVLDAFVERLQSELQTLPFAHAPQSWGARVREFYCGDHS